jgi:Domain of unknown function (DUF4347)
MDFSKFDLALDSFGTACNPGPLGQPISGRSSIGSSSIAFVDGSLADYQGLANSLMPGTDIVILDSSGDELFQITAELSGRSNVSTVAIFSHGSAGSLSLGSTVVNGGLLNHYSDSIQSWSNAFTDDADILLYGCNVAAGELGQAFMQSLSHLTGADVAASTNLTGSQGLGGDWLLESETGTIESNGILGAQIGAHYNGVLATFLVSNLNDDGSSGSLRVALAGANVTAGADTVFFDPNLVGTIALNPTFGALQIRDAVTIVGPGAINVTIDAGFRHRVFEILPVSAVIADLTLTRGLAPASDVSRSGGAILNQGNLSLINTDITNSVAGRGGGVFNNTNAILNIRAGNFTGNQALILGPTVTGSGGAIFNNGILSTVSPTSLTISLTNFTNNTATRDGGAILNSPGRTASIDSGSFDNNIATNGLGGAIINAASSPTSRGIMTITNSIMQGNRANGASGGLGGAIANLGGLTTDNTLISDSFAGVGGGGFANLGTLATATIKNTSFIGNATNGNGGGIFNDGGRVALRDGSLVSSNQARGLTSGGAGIFNTAPASNFIVRSSSILSNTLTSGTGVEARGIDLFGAFTTGGFNLIGDSRGNTGFRDGVRGDTVLAPFSFFSFPFS